jgi:hypothetical protein
MQQNKQKSKIIQKKTYKPLSQVLPYRRPKPSMPRKQNTIYFGENQNQ